MRDWTAAIRRAVAELRRRRVFRAVVVYLIVAWLLIQIADATFEPLGLPDWSTRLLIVMLGLGFLLACALAWIYDLNPHGIERTESARPRPLEDRRAPVPEVSQPASAVPDASVAILPFADMSEARDQDYFCDGLAEEILNALTSVRGLRVASRTSSFRFRDGKTDARDIGRALNVASIMEGSVRKAGDRVRVTAQLVDAANGYHLWSEHFDRRLEDIFAIQEEIARSVVGALRLSLKTPLELDLQRYAPRDLEAYEYYLRGRQLGARTTVASSRHAPQMFRRAIELDPDYAQAHAGLADALAELMLWRLARPAEVLAEARAASQRALELAPNLAEAHVAHAHTMSLAGEHDAATAAFELAIALNPDLYEAHLYFARHCFSEGNYALAIQEFEAAHATRPDEFQALALAAGAADALGDEAHCREITARALVASSHQAEIDPEDVRARYMTGLLQLRTGDAEAGRASIEAALRMHPEDYGALYNAACFFALSGDATRALDLLERLVDLGGGFRDWTDRDSDLASLRDTPRFREILSRMN